MDTSGTPDAPVIVLKCETCGDVFSLHEGDEVKCPSCGGGDAHAAHEPLL